MTENMNISVVFSAETLPRSRRDQNPLLYLKEERRHLAIKCKSIIKKKFREAAAVQFTRCQASMFVIDE